MTGLPQGVCNIRDAVATGEASAVEICQAYLNRIDTVDKALNAFNQIEYDTALERAAAIDRERVPNDSRLLLGVPIAIKDNICTRGIRTTGSSRILESWVPPYDATVIERLQNAGAIVIGKTNCDEFAMGSSNENSAFGPVRNPWNLERAPGGSSGGSAVAVATEMAAASLGSDTGGSVRQPAALCGVVGLKPTYGRVSRYGLLAFASSLDQIGPLTRTVTDAARMLAVIAGPDPSDSTTSDEPIPNYLKSLTGKLDDLRIGVPRNILGEGVDDKVLQAFDEALETLSSLGVKIREIELPHAQYAIPTYYLIATAEASSNLARYDGVRYTSRVDLDPKVASLSLMYEKTRAQGFGAEVKRRIMLGTYALSAGYYDAYYLKAQQVRTLIKSDYDTAFTEVDSILMPTSPTAAFPLGKRAHDPLEMYLADVFTVSANLAGLPAISVPCGFTSDRLPIGLQCIGRPFDEESLLRLAHGYEQATTWWTETPPI
jgi:aspartyl-tRNA(Asn)/glutamyl-tRNA(Gln) amidotransferase subunit A